MILELKQYCKNKELSLHFVTARETYNIIKAAEKGEKGDPELYRNYVIQEPINRKENFYKHYEPPL